MYSRLDCWFGLGLAAAFLASTLQAQSASNRADFNRDIRPLFAKRCTACHGGVKAAGKVSFVYREQALANGKSGKRAIAPGRPEDSELMRRVTSSDPDERMPQPDHGPALSTTEIDTLRRWIADGAQWSEHWSFVPLSEPAIPTVTNNAWPAVTADFFIFWRLEAECRTPSCDATPSQWLRRVTLDLT